MKPSFSQQPKPLVKRTSCFDGSLYDGTPPQALRAVPALLGLVPDQHHCYQVAGQLNRVPLVIG